MFFGQMNCADSENEVLFQVCQPKWVWQAKNQFYFALKMLLAVLFQRDANFMFELELCAKIES